MTMTSPNLACEVFPSTKSVRGWGFANTGDLVEVFLRGEMILERTGRGEDLVARIARVFLLGFDLCDGLVVTDFDVDFVVRSGDVFMRGFFLEPSDELFSAFSLLVRNVVLFATSHTKTMDLFELRFIQLHVADAQTQRGSIRRSSTQAP